MDGMTKIRMELDISGAKMLQQVQLHNAGLENYIQQGIQAALDEITADSGEVFIKRIKDQVLEVLQNEIHRAIFSYEVKRAIEKTMVEKIQAQVDVYADSIGQKVSEILKAAI